MQVKTDYNMSFTTGGLLENESRILVNEYFQTKDWKISSQNIQNDNMFQYRTMVATKRIIQELKARFSYLNEDALQLTVSGFPNETQQILWFAICQKHKFIFDFVREAIIWSSDIDSLFKPKITGYQEYSCIKAEEIISKRSPISVFKYIDDSALYYDFSEDE